MSNYLKKYSRFVPCVALLGIATGAYPMENRSEQVPSLKTLCVDYIRTHANEVDLLHNLCNLPADIACDSRLYDVSYLNQHHHAVTSLIHEGELDHSVLSSIAHKLCRAKKSLKRIMVAQIQLLCSPSSVRLPFDLGNKVDAILEIKNTCAIIDIDSTARAIRRSI